MREKITPQSISSDGTRVDLSELIAMRHEAKRLNMAPGGKVLATRSGGHLSRFRGRGMEFDESRVYQPGDDPRNMDWRVTARSGQPHVKLFREERERPVWLLVDRGPSMRFGTRVAFKSVIVARAAALLAWAAADQGDRVGGLVFDETRSYQRQPAVGNRGVLPLLKALSQDPLPGSDTGYGSLSRAAQFLLGSVRPGSLVFLLSDFTGLDARNSDWLIQLTRGNEVMMIHTYDPLEAARRLSAPRPASRTTSQWATECRSALNPEWRTIRRPTACATASWMPRVARCVRDGAGASGNTSTRWRRCAAAIAQI